MYIFDSNDPFGEADRLDNWQQKRMCARQFCENALESLRGSAARRIEQLPLASLFYEESDERATFERRMLCATQVKEKKLIRLLELGTRVDQVEHNTLTDFDGWNMWDIGKGLMGSGAAGGVAVAARAAPGLLGAVGLGAASAFVAPFAIVAGVAALGVSTYSALTGKREEYFTAVDTALQSLVIGETGSVLSRQYAYIDEFYQIFS